MASFRKRGKTWRAEVRRVGKQALSATFDTKAEAVRWAHEIESGIKSAGAGSQTLLKALQRYREDVAPTRRGARWEELRLLKFERDWDQVRRPLAELSASHIAAWRDARLKEVANGTVAREMNLLRAVLEVARLEWGWIATQPMTDVKTPPEPPPRRRRVPQDEIDRMCAALGYHEPKAPQKASQRVALAFLFAIETGMRSGEIIGLQWADVHARHVVLPTTKNGDRREVPLSAEARRILDLLPRGAVPVFGITSAVRDVLFREARDAIGIVNLHFHDSRAEAIWRLSKKLDVLQLARMVGHRDLRSLQIYYNESADEISRQLDAADAQRKPRGRARPKP
jgi:integrase